MMAHIPLNWTSFRGSPRLPGTPPLLTCVAILQSSGKALPEQHNQLLKEGLVLPLWAFPYASLNGGDFHGAHMFGLR